MNKPNSPFFIRAGAMSALIWLSACGADLSFGEKSIGQRCFSDPDCAEGLVCRDRICIATSGVVVTPPDMSDMPDDQPDADMPDEEMSMSCRRGERRCMGERAYQICTPNADGRLEFEGRMCDPDSRCSDGACIDPARCVDADGDGAFADCEPRDCDDNNLNVSPGAPELCNGVDDNCDGQIDEMCVPQSCCDDGCAAGEACSQCACVPFEPAVCAFQDQPCSGPEIRQGDFVCTDVFETGERRCQGICDRRDLNSCPTPGSVCAFDAGDGNAGLCAQGCTQAQGCGPGFGCLLVDGYPTEGVCVPSGDTPIGASCDDQTPFSCASGSLCVALDDDQARCVATCRPFHNLNTPDQTDCQADQRCLPLSSELGACVPDSGGRLGDSCDMELSACGDDAVICAPDVQGRLSCQQLCRLERDQADCAMGQLCIPFSQNEPDLGVCMFLDAPG